MRAVGGSWVCVHEGFPLVALPGGNVFFSDVDATTPERPDGSRLISCKQVSGGRALTDIVKASRYLARLAAELPLP